MVIALTKTNIIKTVSLSLQLEEAAHQSRGIEVAEDRRSCAYHTRHPIQRVMPAGCWLLCSFPHVHSPEPQSGMVLLQWVGLSASVNTMRITPSQAQSPISQVLLDFVRLTVSTDHHSRQP